MKIAVKILPKKEVLDSQGRTVQNILEDKGYDVTECRVGKYIVLDIDTEDPKNAKTEADKIAKTILNNNLIETYELEILN